MVVGQHIYMGEGVGSGYGDLHSVVQYFHTRDYNEAYIAPLLER